MLNLVQHRGGKQQQLSILESITDALGTIKERQPLIFLKWMYLLQSLNFSDVKFWKKQISSSSHSSGANGTGAGNQDKATGDGYHHVPWEEQTIRRGTLFLYCEVVLSHLKVSLAVAK